MEHTFEQLKWYLNTLFQNQHFNNSVDCLIIDKVGEYQIKTTQNNWTTVINPRITVMTIDDLAQLIINNKGVTVSNSDTNYSTYFIESNNLYKISLVVNRGVIASTNKHNNDEYHIKVTRLHKKVYKLNTNAVSLSNNTGLSYDVLSTLTDCLAGNNIYSFLKNAIACNKNIIISGNTNTSKVTLFNDLVKEIPTESERVVKVDDINNSSKLQKLSHPNSVEFQVKDLGAVSFTKDIVELEPTVVVVEDLEHVDVYDFMKMLSISPVSCLTTVTANDLVQTVNQLVLMIKSTPKGKYLSSKFIQDYILRKVDIIINLENINGDICLNEIYFKDLHLNDLKAKLA